ncbi:MAG: Hsp20/alpha crystallin family protein [Blastopirellula sp. JB062]
MVRALTAYHPRNFADLRREMDGLFGALLNSDAQSAVAAWMPSLNVAETEAAYEVSVEIPGIAPEDVHVELKEGLLTISGERRQDQETEDKKYHRVEHVYGKFERSLRLTSPVDEDNVSAEYDQGILNVTIPKAEKARPRKIEVKAK